MKELVCRDAGFDCQGVVRAESADEVLDQAAEHARDVHRVEVTPGMRTQLATLVRDAQPPSAQTATE